MRHHKNIEAESFETQSSEVEDPHPETNENQFPENKSTKEKLRKIYLEVSSDTYILAKTHGAKYDRLKGKYYVFNEVPNELINLLPRDEITRKGYRNLSPTCPLCLGNMELKFGSKNGKDFWGCLNYKSKEKCKGTYPYEIGLDLINQSLKERSEKSSVLTEIEKNSLQALIVEIGNISKKVFRGDNDFLNWMNTPKLALNHRTPIKCMLNSSDCTLILKLLNELHKDSS